jgi:regulation of enolase protein 1 (concanavalin A-like superfamily)
VTDVRIPAVPAPLRWATEPEQWSLDDGALTIVAGPTTDLFVDPQGAPPKLEAPRVLGRVEGDFQLSARVTVDFRATFDAGVLLLWVGERTWAKLCFEASPDRRPTVVSVVTHGRSDDANAWAVDADQVWLRVSRLQPSFAFHASTDGRRWELVRHFALDGDPELGFLAQSPTGEGCEVTFDEISFSAERLADLRNGS